MNLIFDVKTEDLESLKIESIKLPVGFRYFFVRLLCDKKIRDSKNTGNNDIMILGLIESCIAVGDNLKATELSNRMQNKTLSTVPMLLLDAKIKPETVFESIYNLTDIHQKTSALRSLIKICEEYKHIGTLEKISSRAYEGAFFNFHEGQNWGEGFSNALLIFLGARLPLARCYIEKDQIPLALHLSRQTTEGANGILRSFETGGYYIGSEKDLRNQRRSKLADKFLEVSCEILGEVARYYINKKNYTKFEKLLKEYSDKKEYDGLLIDLSKNFRALSIEPAKLYDYVIKMRGDTNRLKCLFTLARYAIYKEDIKLAVQIAKGNLSKEECTHYQSQVFELLANYALEKGDINQADNYLEQIKVQDIRQRILQKIESSPGNDNRFLI